MKNNCLLISDVHSRDDALERLLDKLAPEIAAGAHLVFLGDLSDCRDKLYQPKASFLRVYKLVRQLCDEGVAELVQSNHGQNITDHYLGRRKVRRGISGFGRTLDEIDNLSDSAKQDLVSWLDSRPVVYRYCTGGKNYNMAHAFYHKEFELSYFDPATQLTADQLEKTIRGRKTSWLWQGKTYSKFCGFWKNPKRWGAVGSEVLCSGHWSQVVVDTNCVVNDPGGQHTDGTLGVFDCNNHKLKVYENTKL